MQFRSVLAQCQSLVFLKQANLHIHSVEVSQQANYMVYLHKFQILRTKLTMVYLSRMDVVLMSACPVSESGLP